MARAKQQELTLEEKLEQTLVPESEWPYEVPGNWVWTRLGTVAKWGSGGTPSRRIPNYYIGNIPWVKTGELDNSFIFDTEEKISEEAIKNSSAKLFPENTVVIAMYGATIGKTAILGIQATTNQACACGVSSLALYYKYLFYYAVSQKDSFIKMSKGGAQPNISQEIIKAHPVPLPPLPEQQRIVDRIESLFAKLDQAKELAQNALDTFETRKAAILHKAFTGELTAKWREKNGVGMESWEEYYWSNLANTVKDKFDPALDTSILPYVGLEHIAKGNGIIAIGKAENVKSLKTIFKSGDILYGKLRPYLNKHDIANFDGMCSTDILAFRTNNETTAKYLNYLLDTTPFINYAVSNSKGINLPRVSEKEIAKYIVNIPSLPEQQEIVRILDSLFEKEQKAKELCDVIDKIDLMKKAILARAFRGELGTNDPSEESAVELLK